MKSPNKCRKAKKNAQQAVDGMLTPLNSPERDNPNDHDGEELAGYRILENTPVKPGPSSNRQAAGRKKVRKDRSKAYKEVYIYKLRVALKKDTQCRGRYRKQAKQAASKQTGNNTPRSTANKLLKTGNVRRSEESAGLRQRGHQDVKPHVF